MAGWDTKTRSAARVTFFFMKQGIEGDKQV